MPQNITLIQLQFLRQRLNQFVTQNFSLLEQRSMFMSIEMERLKLEQFLQEEKEHSKQEPDEMETQIFQARDFQENASIMEQIRIVSNQLDQAPSDVSLWQERAALWKQNGDQTAMLSDLLRAKKFSKSSTS